MSIVLNRVKGQTRVIVQSDPSISLTAAGLKVELTMARVDLSQFQGKQTVHVTTNTYYHC